MTTLRLLAVLFAAVVAAPAGAQLRRPTRAVLPVVAADHAAEIQARIDAAARAGVQEVRLAAGVYRLKRPLVLRPANVFGTVRLVGAGARYNGDSRFGGTELIADFDGPAVVVNMGRRSTVERLSIRGPLWPKLFGKDYPGDDLGKWPGERKRLNPSAGVAIDVGTGGSGSEHPAVIDCEIGGFEVGVVTKPDGGDGNGDFLTVRGCRILCCVYAVSIGHTQSRRVTVEDCTVQSCHTFLTNRDHGRGLGEVDGWVRGDFNQVSRLCYLTQAYAGPCVFQSCYGELIGSLGNFDSGGARAATRTVFRDCRFNFDLLPAGLIADGGAILLDGGIFQTPDLPVVGSVCEVRGAKFRPAYYEGFGPFTEGRRAAANKFPLIDRPHPAKTGTGIGDVKSTAYFPRLDSDYQVGWDGPYPRRIFDVWEKRDVAFFDEVAILPPKAKPSPGDVLQCDRDLTAWVVVSVAADGKTVRLDRVNNHGRKVVSDGHFYLVRSDAAK